MGQTGRTGHFHGRDGCLLHLNLQEELQAWVDIFLDKIQFTARTFDAINEASPYQWHIQRAAGRLAALHDDPPTMKHPS